MGLASTGSQHCSAPCFESLKYLELAKARGQSFNPCSEERECSAACAQHTPRSCRALLPRGGRVGASAERGCRSSQPWGEIGRRVRHEGLGTRGPPAENAAEPPWVPVLRWRIECRVLRCPQSPVAETLPAASLPAFLNHGRFPTPLTRAGLAPVLSEPVPAHHCPVGSLAIGSFSQAPGCVLLHV